ncbi:hypothetical protein C7405_12652 [Paraburkholderia caballeronis]|nr:hypothetical protein C7405_12652 [Paraburkholderia caballeronis]
MHPRVRDAAAPAHAEEGDYNAALKSVPKWERGENDDRT